jgi:hypothetical protein
MKKSVLLFLVMVLAVGGCIFPPELDNVPKINFVNMHFTKIPGPDNDPNQEMDALMLVFDFEDGDGDIGLDDSFKDLKFQEYWFILDEEGNKIEYGSDPNLPPLNNRDYVAEVNIVEGKQVPTGKYFLVQRNENYFNMFINLYIKKGGKYQYFDPWERLQTTFHARIPVIRRDVKSTQGTIKYAFKSYAWPYIVPNDTVRIEFFIKDRALNQSNTITTPDFLIRQLMNQ